MKIIKRSGIEADFDAKKIESAVRKAAKETASEKLTEKVISNIAREVERLAGNLGRAASVEEIQDMVIHEILKVDEQTGLVYSNYRFTRALARKANTTDDKIFAIINQESEEAKQENSNKNPDILSVQRDYVAGTVSRDICDRILFPADLTKAHQNGEIHIHDTDYISFREHNCCLVNLEDMLQNGTVISGTAIEKPHSFKTACNIATQIVAQVASSQYGGQTISLSHLAPFVDISRKKIAREVTAEMEDFGFQLTEDQLTEVVNRRLLKEIKDGCQTIQYQLVTLMTTNGQTPFVTVFMYIDEVPEGQVRDDLILVIREMLKQRIDGLKNEDGIAVTPAFPKLIYVLDEDNVYEGSKYYEITKLAATCTAKRMVPDYISAKVMKELKGDIYPCMGCRSFLTPDKEGLGPDGSHKYYGRFNQGVCTINLVDVACTAEGDADKFWKVLDERLDLCHRVLRIRHERLMGTKSDVAPILWQHGALARLKKGETIDKLLFDNYSTISLGYAGLAECVYRMMGISHTSEEGRKFGLAVMQKLNDACAEWKAAENIAYSVYGTPLESTTYKFAKCLQKKFGKIEGVTDKNYITNSYHVKVTEEINAFDKLTKEAEFQKLSPGGGTNILN